MRDEEGRRREGRALLRGSWPWLAPPGLPFISGFAGSRGFPSHKDHLALPRHSESIHFKLFSPVQFFQWLTHISETVIQNKNNRGTLNTLGSVKETKHKGPCTGTIPFYGTPRIGKFVETEGRLGVARGCGQSRWKKTAWLSWGFLEGGEEGG